MNTVLHIVAIWLLPSLALAGERPQENPYPLVGSQVRDANIPGVLGAEKQRQLDEAVDAATRQNEKKP